jgi:hypothetical protein
MKGIYTYIPETNHVPKEYNVADILSLLFMVIIIIIIMVLLLLLLLLTAIELSLGGTTNKTSKKTYK